MRRWLALLVLLCGVTSAGWANSVAIGQLQYLGTNAQSISAFRVILDPTGVTSTQLNFANVTLALKGSSQSAGAITTPTTLLFLGGPGQALPSCPCQMVGLELLLSDNHKPITLRLANGQLITVPALTSITLQRSGGRTALEPGDSVPIVLTSVPEPGTLVLMTTGLAAAALHFGSQRRGRRRSMSNIA
jgi:hypothetical protein